MLERERVLVFTPTFNEKTNIVLWLRSVSELQPHADLLVVDDSSTDGTAEILNNFARTNPKLTVLERPMKSGVGSAHALAIAHAHNAGYEYIVAMDADLSHDPADISRILEASRHSDYVVATRSKRKGGKNELPGLRKLWSLGANLLCRILIPTGLSEYTTSFRCYNRNAMKALISNPPKNEGYSFFIEVTEVVYKAHLKLSEVPITFYNRKFEESKIPKMQIFRSAGTIMRLILGRLKPRKR
jgi:dolichol-phosphate mannosyltransferase